MEYNLVFSDQAKLEIEYFKQTGNKTILKKLLKLFQELQSHPFYGTGRPEALKHSLSGLWSSPINLEHRLVYQVLDSNINVISVKGHY
ncbi:Txe/YoeB family addiction module toxin [Pedobacter deserti]|uniref:Txe/YoeB family addiction module toxin n=1 Tax=Pedobacter deserti TaxID=2817382 RepID=UPI00210E1BA1|nr:Txe/YoeB family addiction module toxin [Pedobacter sp. SYSU D00382]